MGRMIGIHPHGAEFKQIEAATMMTDAHLLKEGRTAGGELDEDGDGHTQQQRHRSGEENQREVKRPFPCWASNDVSTSFTLWTAFFRFCSSRHNT